VPRELESATYELFSERLGNSPIPDVKELKDGIVYINAELKADHEFNLLWQKIVKGPLGLLNNLMGKACGVDIVDVYIKGRSSGYGLSL
jgi:hypothetical protein